MIGTLVLGIGVATMVFKLVAPALLLPYSFPHSEELFLIGQRQRDQGEQDKTFRPFNLPVQFQAYRDQTSVFRGYAVLRKDLVNVVIAHEPGMVSLHQISPDFFPTLGIKAALGRIFLPEEFTEGRGRVVVISDAFWRARFNADANVLGQTLVVDQDPCTIVGVLPAGQMWPVYFDHGGDFLTDGVASRPGQSADRRAFCPGADPAGNCRGKGPGRAGPGGAAGIAAGSDAVS